MSNDNNKVKEFIHKLCQLDKYRRELIAKRDVKILGNELIKAIGRMNSKVDSNSRISVEEVKRDLFHGRIISIKPVPVSESDIILAKYSPYLDELSLSIFIPISDYKHQYSMVKNWIYEALLTKIRVLVPEQFVNLVDNIFSYWNIRWMKEFRLSRTVSRDGGRDFSAIIKINEAKEISYNEYGKDEYIVGQIKHLKGKAGSPDIQKFIGSIDTHRPKLKYGLFISTNGFSASAINAIEGSSYNIFYKDANWLVDIMLKYRIGVNAETIRGFSIDEIFWKDISK